MEMNVLNNHVLRLLESVERNLSSYVKYKKHETLHAMRVDIKELIAVLSFAENIHKEKHDASKLKPLFVKAGKIREIQMHIKLLSAVTPPPERLINRLKKKESLLIQQFVKNSTRHLATIRHFRKNTRLPEKLPGKKAIIKYFIKRKKKACKRLRLIDRQGLHRYRKKIKKMMYIHKALPEKMQEKINLNISKFDHQQKKLGDWHDTYSAILSFAGEPVTLTETGYIHKLKEKEERQFKALILGLSKKNK